MLSIKQDALAFELGEDWNQQKISLLEAKETIDPAILQQVAKALKVPVEAIKSFDEDTAIVNIQNNYEGSNNHGANSSFDNGSVGVNYFPTFNSTEKIIQLHEEKIALYERMLKEKDEIMARLERLIEKK